MSEENFCIIVDEDGVGLSGMFWEDLVDLLREKFKVDLFLAVELVQEYQEMCVNRKKLDRAIERMEDSKLKEIVKFLRDHTEWR
jgi:hypothetical protein